MFLKHQDVIFLKKKNSWKPVILTTDQKTGVVKRFFKCYIFVENVLYVYIYYVIYYLSCYIFALYMLYAYYIKALFYLIAEKMKKKIE